MVESWPARLVGERAAGVVGRVRGQTAVNGGSELLIFVPRAAHSHDKVDSGHVARCGVDGRPDAGGVTGRG